MQMEVQADPSRWNKLRQYRLLPNDRMALSFANLGPLDPAFGFSTRLGCLCRRAQLWQQFAEPAPHLLRAWHTMLVFPRTQLRFHQITCQPQMIVSNGHHLRPPLELFWSTQTWLVPQQGLFVKAIAMLLPEAQNVSQSDLRRI